MALHTDTERIRFLLKAEAELADFLSDGELSTQASDRPVIFHKHDPTWKASFSQT